MGLIKNVTVYLMKENPRLVIEENQNSSPAAAKLCLENNNTFILKAEVQSFDEFKTIEVNQDSFAKNDLTNAFDSNM